MPTQKPNYLFLLVSFGSFPLPFTLFGTLLKLATTRLDPPLRHPLPTPLSLLEIVFITTHVVHKMAGMALLVLTKYIYHPLLHIGCPRNITEPIDIILQ